MVNKKEVDEIMRMVKVAKICLRLLYDRDFRFDFCWYRGLYNYLPDTLFLRKLYFAKLGKKLNLENPQTYNEKLQWLKLHDFKPEYTKMVDKYEAKLFAAEQIGEEHIIPTYGIWNSFEEIDFADLPNEFVLKCTHDSGGLVICKNKDQLDMELARKKIQGSLRRNWFYHGREYPYKHITPRIIAEKYMYDNESDENNLTDYKFFCFDGIPQYVMTVRDRSLGVQKSIHRWYDMQWNLQDLDLDYRNEVKTPEQKPKQFAEMCEIASKLSTGLKHVRIDLYLVDEQIYFGEMTFYHKSGVEVFEPKKWDCILGSLINIP